MKIKKELLIDENYRANQEIPRYDQDSLTQTSSGSNIHNITRQRLHCLIITGILGLYFFHI